VFLRGVSGTGHSRHAVAVGLVGVAAVEWVLFCGWAGREGWERPWSSVGVRVARGGAEARGEGAGSGAGCVRLRRRTCVQGLREAKRPGWRGEGAPTWPLTAWAGRWGWGSRCCGPAPRVGTHVLGGEGWWTDVYVYIVASFCQLEPRGDPDIQI